MANVLKGDPALAQRLHARLQNVAEIAVPVDGGIAYVYRARRPALPPAGSVTN